MLPHPPGTSIRLTDARARPPAHLPKGDQLESALDDLAERFGTLQHALGAENRRALLVVLQGRDASGKDGTIRRVFKGANPTYCSVAAFKRPAGEETRHDYLWRVHRVMPPKGSIGVFNRSHYEDVLAARVHQLVPESVWKKRYDHINGFERMLSDEGTVIRKFFLHVSREEQRERLESRLRDPAKNWKFDANDLRERARWNDYTRAYQDLLRRCSTDFAPWYVIPADQNKPRDYLVLKVLVETLEAMNPQYPKADPGLLKKLGRIR